jgi:hypothetical protein
MMLVYKTGCSAGEQYSHGLFSKVLLGAQGWGVEAGNRLDKTHFVNQCRSDDAGTDVSALRLRFHPEPRGAGGKDRSYRQGRMLLRFEGGQFIRYLI